MARPKKQPKDKCIRIHMSFVKSDLLKYIENSAKKFGVTRQEFIKIAVKVADKSKLKEAFRSLSEKS